jgi:hypothetical protein
MWPAFSVFRVGDLERQARESALAGAGSSRADAAKLSFSRRRRAHVTTCTPAQWIGARRG